MTDELPERIELTLADQIYIEKQGLPSALRNRLTRVAAFQNPEFYKAQPMRLPTFDKPRIIACADELACHIALPRGCLEDVQSLLSDLQIDFCGRDKRIAGMPLEVTFAGRLRPGQQAAAHSLLAHEMGVLAATTAVGMRVVAAYLSTSDSTRGRIIDECELSGPAELKN